MVEYILLKGKSFGWRGQDTHKVPMEMFSKNRQRLCQQLRKSIKIPPDAMVFLEGGKNIPFYNTDQNFYLFRQEPYFFWAFGIGLPNCIGLIEVSTGIEHIFIPHTSEEDIIWSGRPLLWNEYYSLAYDVKSIRHLDKLHEYLDSLDSVTLLILKGVNTDSGLEMPPIRFPISDYVVRDDILFDVMTDLRVIKSEEEIELMRFVAQLTTDAHKYVMNMIKPGVMEYQGEAAFKYYIYKVGGCRRTAYPCICASGPNSGMLKYGNETAANKRKIKDGDLCLFDMGAIYIGYSSDVVCTFPSNGVFTEDQKDIYNAVLMSSQAVIGALKPAQSWVTMNKLANRVLLTELRRIGLLVGDIELMMEMQIQAYFQPHDIGHFIGIDVHDVGGYAPGYPQRPRQKSLKFLRTARAMEEGMVLSVQPGCYFINSLMDQILNDSRLNVFINRKVLQRFRQFGGVRIGHMVVITKEGCEVLTTNLPRTVKEIELFLSKKEFIRSPPRDDRPKDVSN